MNRRKFVTVIGAVCAFPTALLGRSKPVHRFHKGTIIRKHFQGDFIDDPRMLAEYCGFRAKDLGWISHHKTQENFRWIGLDLPWPEGFYLGAVFVSPSWWKAHPDSSKKTALINLLAMVKRGGREKFLTASANWIKIFTAQEGERNA